MFEKGNISIHTENIFPIIKKWLYSEKDIFLRELVSNASDAISKHKKLVSIGDAPDAGGEGYRINVILDKEAGTIAIEDNGIGMTADEVKKYINQIAFSGAKDFMEKYSGKADDAQIIGHFGLGFYSAFMVSERVTIDTLSWQEGAEAVRWESDGGTEFQLDESERDTRGTTVTLFLAEDSKEFLDMYKLRETLTKYFEFLSVEIFLDEVKEEETEDKKEEEVEQPKPLNDTHPLWMKNPKDCTDEEYKEFYKKTFRDFNDPLFWIHLNLEYPFSLKGILYFPKLKHEFETIEGKIKLFYNQVFVADNLKEVIPEFLLLLKGCLDCPDLPLNVSRSFLQNDGTIRRLATHITKKVSDKLNALYNTEFDNYCKYWDDISPFVKYGCMRDDKFYDAVKDIVLYKSINDSYITLKKEEAEGEEKKEQTYYYVSDQKAQSQYISTFKEHGLDAVILDTMIDSHFINFIEMKGGIRFKGIDSDISEALKADEAQLNEKDSGALAKFISKLLDLENEEFKKARGTFKVEVKPLKSTAVPAMLEQSEEAKRMAEMSRTFGGMDLSAMYPKEETLILNANHSLVEELFGMKDKKDLKDRAKLISDYLLDLAVLQSRQLEPQEMKSFIERSVELMKKAN